MLTVISRQVPAQESKKGKITCITCKLKGCIGKCRFQVVDRPEPPRAA